MTNQVFFHHLVLAFRLLIHTAAGTTKRSDVLLLFRMGKLQILANTVEPLVEATYLERPVFQNTKSFQVKSLYLEPFVSDYVS